nr:glutathione ABC transporter substrate-binding protein [Wansuia hejianensis]
MEIGAALAESWKQVDDKTWEFKLRQGVKFHNGEEMKASDVVFSFDRMANSPDVAHIIGAVESVEEKDEYTIIIKTKEPFAPLLGHLAHTASSILSEKAVKDAGDDYHSKPVGTGPFKFVSHESGDRVTLERFDDYYGDRAKVQKLIFRNIPEGTNRTIGLQTGEIDIAYDIEPIDVKTVKGDKKLSLVEGPSLSTAYIGFNTKKAPFDNVKVRQALNYAINVEEIIEVALEGGGTKATGPINDEVFGYNKSLTGYEYNPEKAKELLKEAGFENGFKTTIWTNDNPVRVTIAEIVQGQLKEIGIQVTVEQVEWGAYLERTAKGEHDMFILGWVTVTGDADYGLYALFHSTQHGEAGNRTFYTNNEVDKLLEKGRVSTDDSERINAYHKAQDMIVEEAPQLFLYFDTQKVGTQKNVEGFKIHPAGHHRLGNVGIGK